MIVQRHTIVARPGNRDEMVEILQALWKLTPHPTPTYRIYLPMGSLDVIQQEIEFEDFEAQEKFWAAAAWSMPEGAPYRKKWNELRDSGVTVELLGLVE
jgi:hypothetical protein